MTRASISVLLIAACCVTPTIARADDTCQRGADIHGWYTPDHAKVQTGGQLGLITFALGYEAWNVIDVDFYYGWVPAQLGGVSIHSVAARIGVHAPGLCLSPTVRWRYLTGGVGVLATFGRRFFIDSPDRYPYNYPQTAARGFLVLGTEVEHRASDGLFATHGAFLEVTALDRYAAAWLKNSRTLSFWRVWSTSIGYKVGF